MSMASIKMSASKLTIRKFEPDGSNFKSLQITTEENDGNHFGTRYGEWLEGKIQEKKKDPDQSSRLVVKIVSGSDTDKFNLESIAKEINANLSLYTKYPVLKIPLYDFHSKTVDKNQNLNNESSTNIFNQSPNFPIDDKDLGLQCYVQNKSNLEELSPLEHSLVKVKENNARIMENIQMLNRTLNYTIKKEILDIVNPKPMRTYTCNACGKCFVYETGLKRHYAMRHAMADMQPRWQVVWTCIQCFQVWPCQDQALNHSAGCCNSNHTDCVREIKTSSLLQCEFCEKVYTSIPRLLRHAKLHTTNNNYECNACKMVFSSYKMAEQHWLTCPWLKRYYSFTLPKLLLCNSCDRKFRTYEQLYNHRYKVDHFMTKNHYSPYSVKSIGALVYQCEMCGAWYPSIPSLKTHKNEYHPKHDITMQCKMERNFSNQIYYESSENEFCINQSEERNIEVQ